VRYFRRGAGHPTRDRFCATSSLAASSGKRADALRLDGAIFLQPDLFQIFHKRFLRSRNLFPASWSGPAHDLAQHLAEHPSRIEVEFAHRSDFVDAPF
jgi:hypothetical protein